MKTTPETLVAGYREAGAWGDDTLDSLLASHAQTHPVRIALVDAPNRDGWTSGSPRSLTYAEVNAEVEKLAAFFRTLGLAADHVLGLQAPNTVDAVIALLAGLRADLVVSPLPLHWRQANVLESLNQVGAKALVSADRLETRAIAETARDVAAELFSLRFVFGLGKDIPDGLIDLGPMLQEMGDELPPLEDRRADAADHTATISWSRSSGEIVPVVRTHNHWLATARLVQAEAELEDGCRLVMPYSLGGLTGLGGGLAPWLLAAGTLHLHHPTSLNSLTKHANDVKANCILTPGPLAPLVDRRLSGKKTTILAAWNIASPSPGAFAPTHRIVDLHVADEFSLVAKARGPSAKALPVAVGEYNGSNGCESGPALLELKTKSHKENGEEKVLLVRGPSVPDIGWRTMAAPPLETDTEGFLDTGIPVEEIQGGISGFGIPGTAAHGVGPLTSVDEIYSTYEGVREAAAFLVEDSLLGARLYAALVPDVGTVPDAKAFFAYLDASGVDLAKIPHRVLVLQSLPRNEDGTVNRERLTLRTQRLPAAVA